MRAVSLLFFGAEAAVFAALSAAAFCDVKKRIIPDESVIAAVLGGVVLRLLSGGLAAAGASLSAAFALFVLLSALWRRGFLGGGDAKLIAAAAAGEPLAKLFAFLASIALAGGLVAAVYLAGACVYRRGESAAAQSRGGGPFRGLWREEAARIGARAAIPYALAVLFGWAWSRLS